MRIAGYTIHPACEAMPAMSDDEYQGLKADIAEHGQLEPVELLDGKVIDGRHRLRACHELGVDATFVDTEPPAGAVRYVLSLNLHRRHLSTSQRAALAVDLLPQIEAESKSRQTASLKRGDAPVPANLPERESPEEKGESREIAAALVNVSPRQVSDAKKVKEEAPEAFEKVRSGEATVNAAKREVAPSAPKPKKPPKNGSEVITARQRKEWSDAFGVVQRLIDRFGLRDVHANKLMSSLYERIKSQ